MAQRPVWRGHLRLALVSCPVALYNARHDRSSIRFNLINPETGNRIRMITQDAETGKELERRDLVKGYEFKKNTYLIVTEEDLDSVKVESSALMTVNKFINADSIDPVYYDAAYYMVPDGSAGQDVYVILREAIANTGQVALSRVVIAQRERTIALRPMGNGLIAHTLHEERDLNSSAELFDNVPKLNSDPEMLELAKQLVRRQAGKYDPSDLEDRYELRMRAMLDAKLKGEGVDLQEEETIDRSNVVDLMAALRKSLGDPPVPKTQQAPAEKGAKPARSPKKVKETVQGQQGLKLPIRGGKADSKPEAPARAKDVPVKNSRKRA